MRIKINSNPITVNDSDLVVTWEGGEITAEGTPQEVMTLVAQITGLNKVTSSMPEECKPVTLSSFSIPEPPKKKDICDVWCELLTSLPKEFEKAGIGKYQCVSKLTTSKDKPRYVSIELKDQYISLDLPNPNDNYDTISVLKRVDEVHACSTHMNLVPEIISTVLDDGEVSQFLLKNFTNRED